MAGANANGVDGCGVTGTWTVMEISCSNPNKHLEGTDMDVDQVFGGPTLKAADLQGTEPVVTIATVELKKFDNGNKLVIQFVGKSKALVANKTNSKRIALLYGKNTDGWIGKRIQLYSEMVDFAGEPTMAIRVRQPPQAAPAQQQPVQQQQFVDPDPMPALDRNSGGEIPF